MKLIPVWTQRGLGVTRCRKRVWLSAGGGEGVKVIGGQESSQTKLLLQWRRVETLRGGRTKAEQWGRWGGQSSETPQKHQRLVSKLTRALATTARRVEQCHLAAGRVKARFLPRLMLSFCSVKYMFFWRQCLELKLFKSISQSWCVFLSVSATGF